MANATSTWMANRIRTDVLGLTNMKLALYSDQVDKTGSGTEVSGGSYARQDITLAADGDGVVTNDGVVTFANMPAVTIRSGGLWSGSDLVAYGPLVAEKTLASGEDATLPDGRLTLDFLTA